MEARREPRAVAEPVVATGPPDVAQQKSMLRELASERRAALPAGTRASVARHAGERLVTLLERRLEGRVIALYAATGSELVLDGLAASLRRRGAVSAYPRTDAGAGRMTFHEVSGDQVSGEEMEVGAFGIRQPHATAAEVHPDVVVVPGLAFDRRGHRLGYGGGFYDRWLDGLTGRRPWLVGLCAAQLVLPDIPAEAHDLRLDVLVTEDAVHRTGRL